MDVRRDVVVIGGSAGGVGALDTLVRGLPRDFDAAMLVALHTAEHGPGLLPEILGRSSPVPARFANEGDPVEPGRILVAPPGRHMLVTRSGIALTRGAHENRQRPAVDPLFRSAAVVYGPRVVGVILSGQLDDGTVGLSAVQRCGGLAIVQDESDAAYPSMPASARAHVAVEHALPAAALGGLLGRVTSEDLAVAAPPTPTLIEAEAAMDRGQLDDADLLERLGERSLLSCPECHGALWEISDDVLRFRCHVGHAFNPGALGASHTRALEDALWAAIRGFGESAYIAERVARRQPPSEAATFEARARKAREHAALLRKVIDTLPVV
jgi:two-component system chemotaxis response regulator CheB